MLLSIDIGTGNLQPEKNINRAIDRTYQICFRIDPLPTRGLHAVSAIVLLSVLLYQIMVYYNCKIEKINPKSKRAQLVYNSD